MYAYLLKELHYKSCGHSKLRMRKGNTLSQKDRDVICSYHWCEEARVCIPPFTMKYFPACEDECCKFCLMAEPIKPPLFTQKCPESAAAYTQ
jgi:hypothetical protein